MWVSRVLLERSIHPRVVMELLGHSQVGLTMNTYSHVMPVLISGAATSMEDTLGLRRCRSDYEPCQTLAT